MTEFELTVVHRALCAGTLHPRHATSRLLPRHGTQTTGRRHGQSTSHARYHGTPALMLARTTTATLLPTRSSRRRVLSVRHLSFRILLLPDIDNTHRIILTCVHPCSCATKHDHKSAPVLTTVLTHRAGLSLNTDVTQSFQDRWRALMSVDDLIESVVTFIEQQGLADNTYFMYSSDHGFQLGEFNLLIDKRQSYDHDIRIHLLARGPGIAAGSTFAYPGTQVDLATTWLGLAGLAKPVGMDGRSIAPLIIDPTAPGVPAQTVR